MTLETWIVNLISDATGIGQLILGVALLIIALQLRGLRNDLMSIRTALKEATERIDRHGIAIARLEGWLERHDIPT